MTGNVLRLLAPLSYETSLPSGQYNDSPRRRREVSAEDERACVGRSCHQFPTGSLGLLSIAICARRPLWTRELKG